MDFAAWSDNIDQKRARLFFAPHKSVAAFSKHKFHRNSPSRCVLEQYRLAYQISQFNERLAAALQLTVSLVPPLSPRRAFREAIVNCADSLSDRLSHQCVPRPLTSSLVHANFVSRDKKQRQ